MCVFGSVPEQDTFTAPFAKAVTIYVLILAGFLHIYFFHLSKRVFLPFGCVWKMAEVLPHALFWYFGQKHIGLLVLSWLLLFMYWVGQISHNIGLQFISEDTQECSPSPLL